MVSGTSVMAISTLSSSDEEEVTILDSLMAFTNTINSSCPVRLTVWRQSLLFNGNGYTVYDDLDGSLVFRVDNYACDWKQKMFLMDSSGHVLFTICRRRHQKKLSIFESWEAFKGDKEEVGYGDREKPFMVATKAFSNHCCSITVATGDKYLMKWSCREGWSKIFPAAEATLPIAQEIRHRTGDFFPRKRCFYTDYAIKGGSRSGNGNGYDQ